MEFWTRTLFPPRSTLSLESQSYRYETCQPAKEPIQGDLPVRGNGPSILDLYRQNGKQDRQERFRAVLGQGERNDEIDPQSVAPPVAPGATRRGKMTHGRSKDGESREAVQGRGGQREQSQSGISPSGSVKTLGRRLSIKKINGLAKGKSSRDLKAAGTQNPSLSVPHAPKPILSSHGFDYNKFEDKPLPGIPKERRKGKTNLPPDGKGRGHRRKSTHIDLFDAVQPIKQSMKYEAGRRNYGEDVADRNIEMYRPESAKTSIDSRHGSSSHSRGQSDAGVAYSSSQHIPDADWLNQPWVQEGTKPWEEVREHRSEGRSTRSVRSLRRDEEREWPMRSSSQRNRSKSDASGVGNGKVVRVNWQLQQGGVTEGTDDDSFELGAVTVGDDIFHG